MREPAPNPADRVHLNELGYYEVTRKPTPDELRDYYAQRYYQESRSSYQPTYSEAEREHIEGKLRLRHWVLAQLLQPATGQVATAASAPGNAAAAVPSATSAAAETVPAAALAAVIASRRLVTPSPPLITSLVVSTV